MQILVLVSAGLVAAGLLALAAPAILGWVLPIAGQEPEVQSNTVGPELGGRAARLRRFQRLADTIDLLHELGLQELRDRVAQEGALLVLVPAGDPPKDQGEAS